MIVLLVMQRSWQLLPSRFMLSVGVLLSSSTISRVLQEIELQVCDQNFMQEIYHAYQWRLRRSLLPR
jgi:hypothetical protein